jgi:hypothetical protein
MGLVAAASFSLQLRTVFICQGAADDELSRIVPNGLRDYVSLSEQERVRFTATFMAFLSYSQNAFLKWREGLLAPPLWRGWELVIMNLVCVARWQGVLERTRLHVWR